MSKPARENVEIRVLSTGKGWRVDVHQIGALETRTASRSRHKDAAIADALKLAEIIRNLDYYGFVRLMVEIK